MNAPFEHPFRFRGSMRARQRDAPPYRRKILFEALEPRLLLSADLASPGAADALSGVLLQQEREQSSPQLLRETETALSPGLISFALEGAATVDLADAS